MKKVNSETRSSNFESINGKQIVESHVKSEYITNKKFRLLAKKWNDQFAKDVRLLLKKMEEEYAKTL
jgi:hypothetical protein